MYYFIKRKKREKTHQTAEWKEEGKSWEKFNQCIGVLEAFYDCFLHKIKINETGKDVLVPVKDLTSTSETR